GAAAWRYIAAVPRKQSPRFLASGRPALDFPAAEGPSMAMTRRRLTAGSRPSRARAAGAARTAGRGPGPRPRRTWRPVARGRRRSGAEGPHFVGSERAELSRLQPAHGHGTEGDTLELGDGMPHRLQQPPHLVVLTLVELQLQPGVVVGLEDTDVVDGQ